MKNISVQHPIDSISHHQWVDLLNPQNPQVQSIQRVIGGIHERLWHAIVEMELRREEFLQVYEIATILEQSWNFELIYMVSMIRQSGNINQKDEKWFTVLMTASLRGYTKEVTILLAHPDILVNEKDNMGYTALMRSVLDNHWEITKLLLAHPDILVNEKNKHGQSALMIGAFDGDTEIVESILAHPDTLVNDGDNVWETALTLIRGVDSYEKMELLLSDPRLKFRAHDQVKIALNRSKYAREKALIRKKILERLIGWLFSPISSIAQKISSKKQQ